MNQADDAAGRGGSVPKAADRRKTVGIIGGMGPLATVDLFSKIVRLTKAGRDQDHLHVIIDNNTAIPDRTRAILADGEDPLPQLAASADRLYHAGADFLVMPCNTAHYYHAALSERAKLPILNMLEETARFLAKRGVRRAGLLATDGTVRSGVYAAAMEKSGIALLTPDSGGQRAVMDLIYQGVKAGNRAFDSAPFSAACGHLLEAGAETLVLGCTELPLAFASYGLSFPHADPTCLLAAAAVRFAGGECCGEELTE